MAIKRWIFLPLLLLLGCTTQETVVIIPTEMENSPTAQPILTTIPTEASLCPIHENAEALPSGLSGNLIVRKGWDEDIYLLSLPDLRLRSIINAAEEAGTISVSPDHQFFFVEEEQEPMFVFNKLAFYNASGNFIKEYDIKEEGWEMPPLGVGPGLTWVDEKNFAAAISPLGSFEIVNIETDERREFIFRDGYRLHNPVPAKSFNYEGRVSLSPSLDQVAYSTERDQQIYLAAFDSLEENNNADYYYETNWTRGYDVPPAYSWSSDGKNLAVALSNTHGENRDVQDIYWVGQHGMNVVQLTDFATFYPETQSVWIDSFSISPDNTKIAVLLRTANSKEELQQLTESHPSPPPPLQLLVIDIEDKNVVDYCEIAPGYFRWSPDNFYVTIGNEILDLRNNVFYTITDGYIVGWLKGP